MSTLGIDPSQRHTGLCLLSEIGPSFHEIQPTDKDVLTSSNYLKHELQQFLQKDDRCDSISDYVLEKQLSVGGQMSALLFHVQMSILEVLWKLKTERRLTFSLLMPMPIQLQSYIKKKHGYEGKTGTEYVEHFKKTTGYTGRISQHLVDAFYLARLGEDVSNRQWRYNLPTREAPLTPWTIVNGDY